MGKPREKDPLTHKRSVDMAAEAGLPAGVLNVVHGGKEAVTALMEHPDVCGISFVGSSEVARAIYAGAAAAGKRVQALGGAKNHLVVLPDADPDEVANVCMASIFGSSGQRCLAGSIVVGVGSAYGPVRDRLVDGARGITLGYGLDDASDMGPVISATHRDRVLSYIDAGESEGAKLVVDGRGAAVDGFPDGNWIGPTVFEDVTPDMKLGTDEVFGPVAGLVRVDSVEEAIELMHRNHYGNACSIFTKSGKAARDFRYAAGISMIGVNIGVAAPMAFFPFGGSRGSFYGDLNAQVRDAIEV